MAQDLQEYTLRDLHKLLARPEGVTDQEVEEAVDAKVEEFLVSQRLLHGSMDCSRCGHPMVLEIKDGGRKHARWRCNRRVHRPEKPTQGFRVSGFSILQLFLQVGTFFEHGKSSIKVAFELSYFWAHKFSLEHTVHETGIDRETVKFYFKKFRRFISEYFRRHPILLGGNGMTVEIDETFMTLTKGRMGRPVRRHKKWILTMVERGTMRSYMQVVRWRDRRTLLPIILRHVRPLTTVNTDSWRAYRFLGRLAMFRHRVINHNLNFVDPADHRNHTQNIESANGRWKRWVRVKNGLHNRAIRLHLKEFLWRDRFGERGSVFFNFWSQVAAMYPCRA